MYDAFLVTLARIVCLVFIAVIETLEFNCIIIGGIPFLKELSTFWEYCLSQKCFHVKTALELQFQSTYVNKSVTSYVENHVDAW